MKYLWNIVGRRPSLDSFLTSSFSGRPSVGFLRGRLRGGLFPEEVYRSALISGQVGAPVDRLTGMFFSTVLHLRNVRERPFEQYFETGPAYRESLCNRIILKTFILE